MAQQYDALLVVGFGGPERPEDVLPFLRKVVEGHNVSERRLAEVAKQYEQFGGVSPINSQTQALADALHSALPDRGVDVPLYVGNRNWHRFLAPTIESMAADGVTSALAVATSAFSSYSGCRQYNEDIVTAIAEAGVAADLSIAKIPPYWDIAGLLDTVVDLTNETLAGLDSDSRQRSRLVFTAHSIPLSLAATSEYQDQLTRAAEWVSRHVGRPHELVFQSRSGPPQVPWLEPDIRDYFSTLSSGDIVVVVPIGFTSDHMEVIFDLDTQAAAEARRLGLTMVRVPTVGTHPKFVAGLADSIASRFAGESPNSILGEDARPFPCTNSCCKPPPKPKFE